MSAAQRKAESPLWPGKGCLEAAGCLGWTGCSRSLAQLSHSGTFRDVSPFLSFLQEAVTSLLSSHLLPVPHHHPMASVLDLERNIKQKELYLSHWKKFTAMQTVPATWRNAYGPIYIQPQASLSDKLKQDRSNSPPEHSELYWSTHGQLSFPLLFVPCGAISLPTFLCRSNLFKTCSRNYSDWQF